MHCRAGMYRAFTPGHRKLRAVTCSKRDGGEESRDWTSEAHKRYWTSISQRVQSLKDKLSRWDALSEEERCSASISSSDVRNGDPHGIRDPRPYPCNPESLIWIGMSSWEVKVRSHFVLQKQAFTGMYEICEAFTNMQAMSRIAVFLAEQRMLTPEEVAIMFWGITCGNAVVPEYNESREAENRRKLDKAERESLKSAIAFQCLAGFLQMTDLTRLNTISQTVLQSKLLDVRSQQNFNDLDQLLNSKI